MCHIRFVLPGFLSVCIVLISCSSQHTNELSATIEREIVLRTLPSASGMVINGDSAWIACDDATGLFSLSLRDGSYRKLPFPQYDTGIYRIPKPVKPDFESAAKARIGNNDYILAFGSGSITPYRDSLLIFDPQELEPVRKVSLAAFYNALRQQARLGPGELNVEAAVITPQYLYLLNRGKNLLFTIGWKNFEAYITAPSAKNIPVITYQALQLPVSDNGLAAGFSGACALGDGSLLFSASLEDTRSTTADGAVYGSYIGILSVNNRAMIEAITPLKDPLQQLVMDKVESLDIAGKSADGSLKVYAVVDNDDGSSKLLTIKIKM